MTFDEWYSKLHRKKAEDRIRLKETPVIKSIKGLRNKFSIDIGANVGEYSFILSQYSKEVLAIEPSPDQLIANLELWDLKNVKVISAVISKENGHRDLYVSEWNGLNTISFAYVDAKFYDHELIKCRKVPSYRLDTLAEGLDVGLLKIDVEGAEEEVLHSSKETLQRCHPVLLLETHPTANFESIYEYLKQFNYNIYLGNRKVTTLKPSQNYVCFEKKSWF